MEVRITETYTNDRLNGGETYTTTNINTLEEFTKILLDSARQASEYHYNQEVVVSFPNDGCEVVMVEIYNGYRE